MKQKTRLLALLTAAVMLVSMLPASFAADNDLSFRDVDQSAWYYQAVSFAVGRELMNGYNSETFAPTDALQRSMLAQVFYNWERQPYSGEDEEKPWAGTAPFDDVKAGVWYENAVNWACSEKLMQGDGASFDPEGKISRQEMAVALFSYAGYKDVNQDKSADLSAYSDSSSVADWASRAMSWAVENKLLHIENNALEPTAPARRAELAYAMMNLVDSSSEADQVRLMAGAALAGGSTFEVKDCAVMVEYHFHTGDWWTQGELPMDEVVKRAEETAKANGYVPITAMGEGSKIYALGEPWEDGVALIALGEDGTYRIGAFAAAGGMNRRFAQTNIIWNADWDSWRVYCVEEQDYYEENGQSHPCFSVVLIPG